MVVCKEPKALASYSKTQLANPVEKSKCIECCDAAKAKNCTKFKTEVVEKQKSARKADQCQAEPNAEVIHKFPEFVLIVNFGACRVGQMNRAS